MDLGTEQSGLASLLLKILNERSRHACGIVQDAFDGDDDVAKERRRCLLEGALLIGEAEADA
jgi:hypothetical protein